MGKGILWNIDRPDGMHCFDAAGGQGSGCKDYWWTCLLFLQDVDRYFLKCFAHTWYLANDFHLYMTAPLFSLAYSVHRGLGWSLLGVAVIIGLSIPIILTVQNGWVPDMIAGGNQAFAKKVYFKPWCRAPSFLAGVATAWLWNVYFQHHQGRQATSKGKLRSASFSILGISLCLAATFGRAAFFQCDLLSCMKSNTSPVPKVFQYLWAGFNMFAWSIGVCIIMTLCFQERFVPVIQDFLRLAIWQPLAKLTYAAYLIHTSVLILDYCQLEGPVEYSTPYFAFMFVSFIVGSLLAALLLFLLVEKPCANLQMKLLGGRT
eukprot:TRINITY_DN46530_c0_g1_i1.p1 TRINITY_DN46530_c0_g1~~TRINITY_DN46530_c0_g1_i1.p1  ORF type:complete len:364 (-),score=30.83 TRINITY_DN46530_c0_g1_i1:503-1456(-)